MLHGRPDYDPNGLFQGLREVYRDTVTQADALDDVREICDAIAEEVLIEYGPPIGAIIDAA